MKNFILLVITCFAITFCSCKKFIDAAPPKDEVLSSEAFTDSTTALATLLHIYSKFGKTAGTIEEYFAPYPSLYTDELLPVTANPDNTQFYSDAILPDNTVNAAQWQSLYSVIYECNAFLEGVDASNNFSASLKNQLTGEAKFLRAFSYFLLVNSYGGVPLILSTDVQQTASIPRSDTLSIYNAITDDLTQAETELQENYPSSEKVRVNKWAAKTLLAKINLYLKNWKDAESNADAVIQTGLYTPLQQPSSVFLKNSNEAILQFYENYDYTWSGNNFLPFFGTPNYALTNNLLKIFDLNDRRRNEWIDSIEYNGTIYYYPAKYKNNGFTTANDGEYTMCLRAGELYLIKAEAEYHQNKISEALAAINIIRDRAEIDPIAMPINSDSCLHLIEMERRRELFTEWGNRFFDLKRTGEIDAVLKNLKPTWKSTGALYPIPQTEINYNSNLKQNPGY